MAALWVVTLVLFGAAFVECAKPKCLSALSGGRGQYVIVDDIQANSVLTACFENTITETGWSFLEIHDTRGDAGGNTSDTDIAYLAGMMEVNLTASLMEMQWQNTMADYCTTNPALCQKVIKFVFDNSAYVENNDFSDPRWYQVKLFYRQAAGLGDGYASLGGKLLPDYAFSFFQLYGELDDLAAVFGSNKSNSTRVKGSGSCSAIVKLLPDNSDLLIGHNTWTSYVNMLRIFKLYDFKFSMSSTNKNVIPGHTQAFSSYPGRLFSGDDYYLLSSGLVTMETSIENTNPDLWKFVTPKCVMENARVVVSNRLATSGGEWISYFKVDNSGTYNNQWMIVDYQRFVKGETPPGGLLWVLEQMPGCSAFQDQTNMLINNSYWASYNIPFYPDIYDSSGTGAMAKEYGDFFTYDKAPRAKIFARENGKVTDVPSLISLMQYNNFQHDDLATCQCKPPYSGENGIAARSDLNPPDGTYAFSALGHRLHGAIDLKVTSSELFSQQLSCYASSGPTSAQQPAFQWSTSKNPSGTPQGHPDKWSFAPMLVKWT